MPEVVAVLVLPLPLDDPPPLDEELPPEDVPQPVMALMVVRLSNRIRSDASFGLRRKQASRPRRPPASAMPPDVGMCRAALEPAVVLRMTVVLMVPPPLMEKEAGAVLQVGG